jgi:hypothetical protein
MAEETVTILSGTRSELGGVEVGVANVFERPERAAGLSCLLLFAGKQMVLAPGDDVELGTVRARLLRFEDDRAGISAVFSLLPDDRARLREEPLRSEFSFSPLAAFELAERLRRATPGILRALGSPAASLDWTSASTDRYDREWNGGEIGPSTQTRSVAQCPANCEASVTVDVIRWSPQDVQKTELYAHWRFDSVSAGLFSGSEGEGPLSRAWLTTDSPAIVQQLSAVLDAAL